MWSKKLLLPFSFTLRPAGSVDVSKNVQHMKPETQDAMLSPRISPVHFLHFPLAAVRVQPVGLHRRLGGERTKDTRQERS